ncbi:hypothetical protein Tco_0603761 [Tanacetum coccineum]
MVAYLKKPEGSEGFHQIVDFLNASHIRYALTENPTIYVSLIKQFWQTATARTLDNREIELTATIDGTVKTVTEASVRRHLQLADADGISSFPTTEIFEQLSLMGENIPLFPTMIIQGEGSTHPVESHHTPTSAPSTSQPSVLLTSRRTTRHESMVPQPRSPTQTPITDETVYEKRGDSVERAATTATSLEAEQGSGISSSGSTRHQDTILGDRPAQTRFERLSKQSNDSPLLRVNTLRSDEGMLAYTRHIKKVKKLEKIVKSSQARRRAIIVVSDDEDDLEDPSKQGRKIAEIDQDPGISLVQHDAEIQGRYGHDMEFDFVFDVFSAKKFSTAEKDNTSPSLPSRNTGVSTANDITMAETLVYIRKSATKDKGKGKIDESENEEERQMISRVHEAASSFNVEEWEDIQAKIEGDEELAHRIQAEEREKYTEGEQARMLVKLINQRKRYFAAQRAEERRNTPLTQAQQRFTLKALGSTGRSSELEIILRYINSLMIC